MLNGKREKPPSKFLEVCNRGGFDDETGVASLFGTRVISDMDQGKSEAILMIWNELTENEKAYWMEMSKRYCDPIKWDEKRPCPDFGDYTGGNLPGKKTGYQNFISKQYNNVDEALTNQWTDAGRLAGDVMLELARAWNEMNHVQRDHWKKFAKGKASEPKMSVEDWEELTRERSLEEGAYECRQLYLDDQLGRCNSHLDEDSSTTIDQTVKLSLHEMSQVSIDAVASEVPPKVMKQKDEEEAFASKKFAYMHYHKLDSVLSEAANAAVVAESDNPMVFIANFLYQKADLSPKSFTN